MSIQKFSEREILSSYNFARYCDKVFVEAVTHKQYEKLRNINSYIVNETDLLVVYKNTHFTLEENDVVFCHTAFIGELFYLLKKVDNLKNIKLVTSQSDISINKKLFLKKPKCISEWYSVNVNFDHPNLIPIPLGIANEYSPKNIRYKDLLTYKEDNSKINDQIYCNFNPTTNNKERLRIYKLFEQNSLFKFEEATLLIKDYIKNLSQNKYVLAPCGNGFDTHRLWEALYIGAIPIIREHETYSYLDRKSVVVVEDYDHINLSLLDNFEKNYKSFEDKFLKISWWFEKIRLNQIISKNSIQIKEPKFMTVYRVYEQLFFHKLKSYFKKLKYYSKKIVQKVFRISL